MKANGKQNNNMSSRLINLLIFLGITSTIAFGLLGCATTEKWKEEVQLNDGRIIVVEREIINERGGGEWASNRSGLKPKDYTMRFIHPDEAGKTIEWRSTKKSPRTYPETPLVLDMEAGQPVIFTIVGIRARCEVYCKYLYRSGVWTEEKLPETFEPHMRNLFVRGSNDISKFVDLETKRKINESKHSRKPVTQVGPNREICR